MIDTKEFYEDTPMILRSMVLKDYWKTNHIMHKDYLGEKNQLILGKCIELHSDHCNLRLKISGTATIQNRLSLS